MKPHKQMGHLRGRSSFLSSITNPDFLKVSYKQHSDFRGGKLCPGKMM